MDSRMFLDVLCRWAAADPRAGLAPPSSGPEGHAGPSPGSIVHPAGAGRGGHGALKALCGGHPTWARPLGLWRGLGGVEEKSELLPTGISPLAPGDGTQGSCHPQVSQSPKRGQSEVPPTRAGECQSPFPKPSILGGCQKDPLAHLSCVKHREGE